MTALQMADVRKVYPSGTSQVVALDHASLEVADGEIVAVVGPSGSGKSTLLAIAGGLLRPTEGSVRVSGVDLDAFSPRDLARFRATQVGFVFQASNLVPFLTARENLLVMADLAGAARRRALRARADRLLDELGLTERADGYPEQLSGGERQRVAIGRALMNEPGLVLVDEPTSALDTGLGHQVMHLIRDELHSRGHAAVIVTHDLRMTEYCDRTVEITDGVLGRSAVR